MTTTLRSDSFILRGGDPNFALKEVKEFINLSEQEQEKRFSIFGKELEKQGRDSSHAFLSLVHDELTGKG